MIKKKHVSVYIGHNACIVKEKVLFCISFQTLVIYLLFIYCVLFSIKHMTIFYKSVPFEKDMNGLVAW